MLTIARLLDERLKVKLHKDIFEIMFDTVGKVEAAFNEISETPLRANALHFAYSKEGEAHIDSIMGNWLVMRNKLVKHAHGYLAP
jgi:hypothetical protein